MDVTLSSETFHHYVSAALVHINHILKAILRLFLVEDLVDSLKVSARGGACIAFRVLAREGTRNFRHGSPEREAATGLAVKTPGLSPQKVDRSRPRRRAKG
uniref:Uncharacterized protein n=1 Tax=Pseudonaja textilis TaxID=8673 RepID=A0A670Z925_PSETE